MVGQNKLKSKAYNTGELRKAANSRPAWKILAGRNILDYFFLPQVTKQARPTIQANFEKLQPLLQIVDQPGKDCQEESL